MSKPDAETPGTADPVPGVLMPSGPAGAIIVRGLERYAGRLEET